MNEWYVRAGSRRWDLAAAAFAMLILAVTLGPAGPEASPSDLGPGPPSLADALRNLVLFTPLGALLALAGHSLRAIVLGGFALSGMIELAQLAIPGRFSGWGDVVSNGGGTLLGCVLAQTRAYWLAPASHRIRWLEGFAIASTWLIVGLAGFLFAPELPVGPYYGAWLPEFQGMVRYPGTVIDARVGDLPIPIGGPVQDSRALRQALVSEAALEVRLRAGPTVPGLAPLVILIGPASEEVALLATRGADLIFRRWRRSGSLDLEQPELTWPGAAGQLESGRLYSLRIENEGSGAVLTLDMGDGRSAGIGPGHGWALFAPDRWVSPALRPALDALWLAMLFFPVGLWRLPGVGGTGLALLAVAGLAVLPGSLGLASASAADWLAALAGLAAGGWIRRRPRAAR